MDTTNTDRIKTRFIIISDTHGHALDSPLPTADVAIHCGDLTQHSKLSELRTTIQLLQDIPAPLKLVIAGNHDFTLDDAAFASKLAEADRITEQPIDPALVAQQFGRVGQARQMLQDADHGIHYLSEGTHVFSLDNGARLTVYASPYTPSDGEWAFSYPTRHDHDHLFDMQPGTDVVVTHGPPRGILDRSEDRRRLGCEALFGAVARTQPRLHCFGHVHGGWGAKVVSWRARISETPSHFVDVDHGASVLVDSLAGGGEGEREEAEEGEAEEEAEGEAEEEAERGYRQTSHCEGDEYPVGEGRTLFVNASIMGGRGQRPWVVDVELPLV